MAHKETSTEGKLEAPRVVRIKRKGRAIVQDCDVYIGRSWNMGGWKLGKSKWFNPFTVRACGSARAAVAKYKVYILSRPDLLECLSELDGKTLGCWCAPAPCHGDVLVELFKERVLTTNKRAPNTSAPKDGGHEVPLNTNESTEQ